MSLQNNLRHRMDVVKGYLQNKIEQTLSNLPGERLSLLKRIKNHQEHPIEDFEDFSLVSHFESLLVEFQALLVWDNPSNSSFALTFFTIFYW